MSPSFDLESYEPVQDRIVKFWADHPEGRITTFLVAHHDGEFIVRAEVYKLPPVTGASTNSGVQLPDSTGYAQEREGSNYINKTSALENCETSAIGRALATLGYATKRPSREEMTKSSPPAEGPVGKGGGEPITPPPPTSVGGPEPSQEYGEGSSGGEGPSTDSFAPEDEACKLCELPKHAHKPGAGKHSFKPSGRAA